MAIRLNYNPMSVLTHSNLSRSDQLMERVMSRLSSGERIQRTADDPAGAVVANAVRFYRKGVDRAASNAEEAVSFLQTADGAMDQISSVLLRMRSLAVSASSTATQDPDQLQALQNDLDAAVASITTIAGQASFGGISLLNGSLHDVALSDTAKDYYTKLGTDYTKLPGGMKDGRAVQITPATSVPLTGRSTATAAYTAGIPSSNLAGGPGTVTITGPLGVQVLVVNPTDTIADLVTAANAVASGTGVVATYDQPSGKLLFRSDTFDPVPIDVQVASTAIPTPTIDAATGSLERSATWTDYGPGTTDAALVGGSGSITVTGPKGTTTLAVTSTTTIASLVAAVNAAKGITGVHAGYDNLTGRLTFENTSYGSSPLSIVASGGVSVPPMTSVTAPDRMATVTYQDAAGITQIVTLTQDPNSTDGRTFTNLMGGAPEGAPAPWANFAPGAFSLEVKDTASAGQVGATVIPPTATLDGTRSGTTAFQIGALSSQRVTVDIPDMRAGALGHTANLSFSGYDSLQSLTTNKALMTGGADQALSLIDAAISEVNIARGSAGAMQSNTIERVMESLQVSSQNLSGFESVLRDVDMAAESAEFSRIQVMIQAATAMLAQANQVPQTVLQLLK